MIKIILVIHDNKNHSNQSAIGQSIALYQKHQFEIEGTAKNHAFRGEKLVDSHYMARVI